MSAPGAPPTCRCGHEAAAHEHYRNGTDCSACDVCLRFRPGTRLHRLIDRALRRDRSEKRPRHGRDDGLSALLDAVMTEQNRPTCGCLACQIDYDPDGDT